MTEPLVDIRATLLFAKEKSILTDESCSAILQAARTVHYKERTRAHVTRCIRDIATDGEKIGNWLESNWVEQKKIDALELLACLNDEAYINFGRNNAVNPLATPRLFQSPTSVEYFIDDMLTESALLEIHIRYLIYIPIAMIL